MSPRLLPVLLLAVACGCEHELVTLTQYSGEIERLEETDATVYAPNARTSGQQRVYPLLVWVSLTEPPKTGPRRIVIEISDALDRERFGEIGDSVKFQFAGRLPVNGRIPLRSAIAFTRIPKR